MVGRYFAVLHLAIHGPGNDFFSVAAFGHHGVACDDARQMATTCIQHALWLPHATQHGVGRRLEPCPRSVFCIDEGLDVVDGVVDAIGVVAMGE